MSSFCSLESHCLSSLCLVSCHQTSHWEWPSWCLHRQFKIFSQLWEDVRGRYWVQYPGEFLWSNSNLFYEIFTKICVHAFYLGSKKNDYRNRNCTFTTDKYFFEIFHLVLSLDSRHTHWRRRKCHQGSQGAWRGHHLSGQGEDLRCHLLQQTLLQQTQCQPSQSRYVRNLL